MSENTFSPEASRQPEVSKNFLQLSPEGKARLSYVDNLATGFFAFPKLRREITNHIEQINNPNYENYTEIVNIDGKNGPLDALTILKDGSLVSGSFNEEIYIWDPYTKSQVGKTLDDYSCLHHGLSATSDGDIVFPSNDKSIRLWDPITNKQKGNAFEGHEDYVNSILVLPNNLIVSGSQDKTIRMWDPNTQKQIGKPLEGPSSPITSLTCLSKDIFISGEENGSIRFWNSSTGKESRSFIQRVQVNSLEALSDNLFAVNTEVEVEIWDLNLGDLVNRLTTTGTVDTLAGLSNIHLASADSTNNYIKIWDLRTKSIQKQLQGHTQSISDIITLPNGCIASSSNDGTIRIWGDPKIDYKKFYDLAFPKDKK
jgi:WD40 repeat protein